MEPLHFDIISYDEAKFEYNKKIGVLTDEILSDIKIIFIPVLNYREQTDSVGMQLAVNYLYKDTAILSYGVVLSLTIKEYSKARAEGIDSAKFLDDLEVKKQLFDLAKGFLRGALAIRAKNTMVAKLFLPIFDSTEMAKKTKLHKMN